MISLLYVWLHEWPMSVIAPISVVIIELWTIVKSTNESPGAFQPVSPRIVKKFPVFVLRLFCRSPGIPPVPPGPPSEPGGPPSSVSPPPSSSQPGGGRPIGTSW